MNHDEILWERQVSLEEDMANLGKDRYWNEVEKAEQKGSFGDTYVGSILTKLTIETYQDAIHEWVCDALSGKVGRRNRAASVIKDMDIGGVAYVSTKTILGAVWKQRSLLSVAQAVGKAVMDESRFQTFRSEAPGLYHTVDKRARQNAADEDRRRTVMIYSMGKFDVPFDEWTVNERVQLGTRLVELFAEITGYIQIVTVSSDNGKGMIHVVQPTQWLIDWASDRHERGEIMRPYWLPCVVPPKPWTDMKGGGYHTGHIDLPFVKRGRVDLSEAPAIGDTMEGINWLQATPWKINQPVYDVLSHLWDHGFEIPGLPSRDPIEPPPYPEGGTEEQVKAWKQKTRTTHDMNAKSKGVRVQVHMTLDVAKRLSSYDAIYFPHQCDFRSRGYAVPIGLTPQGPDYSRALLTFSRGVPIEDERAAGWLAIHGANVAGEDKISLPERIDWVYDNEEMILSCADDPFEDDRWREVDKPFCFLAFCFEWAGLRREGFGYVSHLPIALDGTCNGLQHFSALLRDPVGGAAVNLVPQDQPADIYTTVADKVTQKLKEDAKGDDPEVSWFASEWLAYGVNRKVTKRPVMVLPYGGTFLSCLKYTREAINERVQKGEPHAFGDRYKDALTYLAKAIWAALNETVIAARDAMDWLQSVARLMSKYELPITWTTPSGFVCRQKYVQTKQRRVRTLLCGDVTYLSLKEPTDSINPNKQATALSPNFIHSLDAAAMILTILKCVREDITDFAMIHDSYGTHAANTDTLAYLLREAFVEIYQEPVLERFRQEIIAQLPEEARDEVPPIPPMGDLDIQDVLNSDFFFS